MMKQDLSCVDDYCNWSVDLWGFIITFSLTLCMCGMVHHKMLKSTKECGLWRRETALIYLLLGQLTFDSVSQ